MRAIRSPAPDIRSGDSIPAAYGLRLSGLGDDGLLALTGAGDFPHVTVVRERTEMPDYDGHFGPGWAAFPMEGGGVHINRATAVARMHGPRPPSDEDAVHPWLSRVAAAFAHWHGRELLHGGAFLAAGGAWAVLGGNESGKSTLLGRLATSGHTVLSDDALVLDGPDVLVGPRCVDLRPSAAEALGVEHTQPGRAGRVRIRLAPASARVPLAGIVHLRFADRPAAAQQVPLARRIDLLRAQAPMRPKLPPNKLALLELAAMPTLELMRPRDLGALEASAAALLATLPS